jgi:hypothetical protein
VCAARSLPPVKVSCTFRGLLEHRVLLQGDQELNDDRHRAGGAQAEGGPRSQPIHHPGRRILDVSFRSRTAVAHLLCPLN